MVLVNKPIGLSSQQVVTRTKAQLGATKAGHTGTLDPEASGLLPICLNESTKLAGHLLTADKRYRATIKLGVCTSTGDTEGDILYTHHDTLPSPALIEATLPSFIGQQNQVPPRYAALKFQGKKYYEYAREGIEIERPARTIQIFSLRLIDVDLPYITLDVHCSSGTYIRSLAEDIGTTLQCGATLSSLCRTSIGIWTTEHALPLEALPLTASPHAHSSFIPAEEMLHHIPSCLLSTQEVKDLYLGKRIHPRTESDGLYTLFHDMMKSRVLVGLGEIHAGALQTKRLFAAGTYSI
jgi:tRNA pseudouridine55 synthase